MSEYVCSVCGRPMPPLDSTEIVGWGDGGTIAYDGERDPLMLEFVCPWCVARREGKPLPIEDEIMRKLAASCLMDEPFFDDFVRLDGRCVLDGLRRAGYVADEESLELWAMLEEGIFSGKDQVLLLPERFAPAGS